MKVRRPPSQGGETKAIDWGEVRRRMETARAAIEGRATPPPDEKRAILKARAKLLARDPGVEKTAGESIEVIEFLLADESYGIETNFVREVYPLKELTPLPGTPLFILGITNVRGEVLSVIDLPRFFGLPEMAAMDLNKLIIVRQESMEFGIRVDDVSGVRLIPLAEIQRPPSTLTGIGAEFVRGVTKERTVVLDAEKLLTDKKVVVDEARA